MASEQEDRKRALRASLILPVVITIFVLLVGILLLQFIPEDQFNNAVALLASGVMLAFLVFWTRGATWQLRLVALLLALPALAGITAGFVRGSSRFIVVGVGATFLLLVIQRAFSVPTSYRLALRRYRVGDTERALNFVNKTIAMRPDFAEAYQLRAMIRMVYKQFQYAEEDARRAIALQPTVYTNYNTLGQIYLAESRYGDALETFQKAVSLDDSVAINQYHKGLSAYRLGKHQTAAEALSMATRKTLPRIEYDLLAHFYLYKTLNALEQTAVAQKTLEALRNFTDGVPRLRAMAEGEAAYEYILQMRQDVAEIERLVGE